MPETIHLVLKTHLDIGFTDYAIGVVQTYFSRFIPQALTLAAFTRHTPHRFRWTTGAWLIYEYLERATPAERRTMEQAIASGDIQWHALPFTTHTELMDETLFRFGLSYAQRLDRRFGRKTVAAKMTDVPGHTRAIVPLLAEAGVKMLHIGVNPASAVPEVPHAFVWRDLDTSAEICVVYDPAYGGVTRVDDLSDVLAVVLTSDNVGPPTAAELEALHLRLAEENPGAHVAASTLDDFAAPLWENRALLPVVTQEIGDTWIFGVGSDPTKVCRYRELSRLRRAWLERNLPSAERTAVDAFSRHLIMIPEHTWGMDEKTYLPDNTQYTRAELDALRLQDGTRAFEASWAEQRGYLFSAVSALKGTPLDREARAALNAIEPRVPDLGVMVRVDSLTLTSPHAEVHISAETGAVTGWLDTQTGALHSDEAHPLAALRYDVYGQADYDRYWSQYIRGKGDPDVERWAREDNLKIGIPLREGRTWTPIVNGLYRRSESSGVVTLMLLDDAREFGAPARLVLEYTLDGAALDVCLLWFDKPPCRIAEAFWLGFTPRVFDPGAWRFEKMGRWIDPADVVSRGARTLHAVDQRVRCGEAFTLTTLDAPLVAPGAPSLLDFHDRLPDMTGGVHVCLYNNVWATNFPMWFEDNALFRFRLTFAP